MRVFVRIALLLPALLAVSAMSAQPAEPLDDSTTRRLDDLSLETAITLALEKNADIAVERESVAIADAIVRKAEAAYEPMLRGDAKLRERIDPANSILSGAPPGELAPETRSILTSASVSALLPTGATASVFSGIQRDSTNSVLALLTPSWSTFAGAEVRQPLMQNRRIDPARRAIRIARVDRDRALSSLRRTATEVTAAVEKAYWTLVAVRNELGLRSSAVEVAEKQRGDTRVRIEAGTQPEADLAATTAEVERRRGEVVIARENVTRATNALRALIARDADDPLWTSEVVPVEKPLSTLDAPPVAQAIATALAQRPELDELARRLQRHDVEIEAAHDRTRPQVDLVLSYSGRGLAGDPNEDAIEPFGPVFVADDLDGGLGQSFATIGQNEFPDAAIGVSVAIPIGNTAAKQDEAIARAQRRQSVTTMEAARQRVAAEVRNALAALESAEQRIEATRAAREAAEIQLQAERDRFEAGTSNTFFILTRQNDLTAAQVAENIALADRRRAESELARSMGTLLVERGIAVEE